MMSCTRPVLALSLLSTATVFAQPEGSPPNLGVEAAAAAAQGTDSVGFSLASHPGLSLAEVMDTAANSAPSREMAREAIRVAEASVMLAKIALFPRLDMSFRYTRLSPITQPSFGGSSIDPAQVAPVIAGVDDPESRALWTQLFDSLGSQSFSFPVILNQYAFQVSLSYPVSDLLFNIPAYRAAGALREARHAEEVAAARTASLQARDVYFSLARARAAASVAEQSVRDLEAHERRMAALVAAEAAPRVELTRIQSTLARARGGVIRAEGAARLAERSLQVLMHSEQPVGSDYSEMDSIPEPPADVNELIARAIRSRPERQAMQALRTAREGGLVVDMGRRYPQLLLQANLDVANPNNRIIPQDEVFRPTWDVSVILRWSPNDFGVAAQHVIETQSQLRQIDLQMRSLDDAIALEVHSAAEDLLAARASFEAATIAVDAAEQTYRVRRSELEAGVLVGTDLSDAESELTRARLERMDAAITAHAAYSRLRTSVGDGAL